MENKDFWDKLGVIGTFLSTTLIAIFSTVVTYQTSRLTNKVETFEKKIEENKMIGELIQKLSSDTMKTTINSDFTLLTLERYLRNNAENGELTIQDKEMLVGFAESLILNSNKKVAINTEEISYKIPRDFLFKYDTLKWNKIVSLYGVEKTNSVYPKITYNSTIKLQQPVSQVDDSLKSSLISSILKKIVYIQYAPTFETKNAENLQQNFKNNQWAAPRIDKVKGNYNNIIKYFHPEDEGIAIEANKILDNKYKIVPSITSKYQKIVPKGQIEVWASN
ncbi:hypothetical protein [Flavobacterium marginilacus]|uniref:hypothetical protein n=1 Tax=Flavobacterium marginilacus TaxID=3003256 RepID=UPI00248DC499|nr:hypothetical protein [Flavobacterium marginilacus]